MGKINFMIRDGRADKSLLGGYKMEKDTSVIQYTTVSDSVYAWIKNAIIQGDFRPGERIPQESLTRKLGVSRTPVRDAIKRLETEGLLIVKPHCGAVVFQLSKSHLIEIYDVRILLEQYCATRTCLKATDEELDALEDLTMQMLGYLHISKDFMRIDREFHRMVCALSGCVKTLEILEGLWNQCDSFKSIYYSLEGKGHVTIADHSKIVRALKKRDIDAVKEGISAHLKDVVDNVASHVNLL